MRRKTNVAQLMLIAQDLFQKLQYNNAIKILNQVIQLEPKNDEAYRLIADCFDQLGQSEQAEKYYKIGMDRNPVSTLCCANYGMLLYNMGKKDQAEKLYELCMDINPKDPIVLNNYMVLLYQIGKFQKAEEITKECLAVDPKNTNCQVYLKKISESKMKGQRKMRMRPARPNTSEQQLLDLLFQRDTKLAQKETIIQNLQKQLQKRQNEIKQLYSELNLNKKRRAEQQNNRLCKICLHKTAMFMNKKCGHLSACKGCLSIVGKNCPLCRQSGSFIRVYSSMIRQEYY